MSIRVKEHPEDVQQPVMKYRVKPILSGVTVTYMMYIIQKKIWFWWIDLTRPDQDKARLQKCCEELNEFYNKRQN